MVSECIPSSSLLPPINSSWPRGWVCARISHKKSIVNCGERVLSVSGTILCNLLSKEAVEYIRLGKNGDSGSMFDIYLFPLTF